MSGHLHLRILLTIVCLLSSLMCFAQAPQAEFTSNTQEGCSPMVVAFQNQSTNAVQWQWNLGNGTVSFLQNPSATYFVPGTFTVTLIVTNSAGIKDTIIKNNFILVHANPVVNFSASTLSGCFPLPVQFQDETNGNGNIASWSWDFGDGNTSSLQNPQHIYSAPGMYNVTLIVTNEFGCTKSVTKQNYITISSGVTASFTSTAPAACVAPQAVQFTNTSTGTGVLTYNWSFGDGGSSSATNPSHTYLTNGSYSVQLIVTNSTGCSDTINMPSAVNLGTNSPGFSLPSTACAGEVFTINNLSTPAPNSVYWTFGDGSSSTALNPVKQYATPGTYLVKMIAGFGNCFDSTSQFITILTKPNAAFTGTNLVACQPSLTTTFNNSSTNSTSYLWDFGDGNTSTNTNPSHTYTSYGIYTVQLISVNSNGCSDTFTMPDYVMIQAPVVTINDLPQMGCAPFNRNFSATVNSVTAVTGYQWNFGDGTISTSATPSHTFSAGTYDITLIVTTAGGCTDTVQVLNGIVSSPRPVAAFFANPLDACARFPINFTDTSGTGITSWHWNFGDGATSTQQNPIHEYSDTGNFHITLIVGSNGCYDTLTKLDYIHIKPPIANFAVPYDCTNKYTKVFIDQSIGADQWLWDFGDGNTSTLQNPTHTYSSTGTYTVTLTVINNASGCDHSHENIVYVAEEQALFTANITQLCKGTEAVFTASSIQAQPLITNYAWNFGDGSTGSGQQATHIYTQTGIFDVTLIITDINGCTDTLSKIQYIKIYGPSAEFMSSVPGTCLQSSVTFIDLSSTDGIHPINQWSWNYGDGTFDLNASSPFTHQYNTPGVFSVVLTITDTYGCRDSITKVNMITVSSPQSVFVASDTLSCPGSDISFINNSTGPSLTYNWNFGDGNTSNISSPTHQYSADGAYTVTLTVTDMYGCVGTSSQIMNIATPSASFAVSDTFSTCPPLIVNFTNNAQNYASFLWDFGNGNTSTAQNPTHFYNVAGSYVASLTVTSPGGCVVVNTRNINISGPQGSFTYNPTLGCSPLLVSFSATTSATASFVWDFNDGTTTPTTDSTVSHVYTLPGIYVPKMIIMDQGGCAVAIDGTDTITVNGVVADYSVNTTSRCNEGAIQFTNQSISNQNITSYLWNFGDGTSSAEMHPLHYYNTTGNYVTSLIVTTSGGCVDTFSLNTPINIVTAPQITASSSANTCAPANMVLTGVLTNSDTLALTWNWNYGPGNTSTGIQTPPLLHNTAGVYNYQLICTNSFGCADTTSGNYEVYGRPNVSAGIDLRICENSGQALEATGADFYTWSPAEDLSCTNCPNPIATPDSVRTYTVTGVDANGCTNTDEVVVTVIYPFTMTYSPGDTLCVGERTTLSVGGANTYTWSPSNGLSGTAEPSVSANPINTTLYTVVGSDASGCFQDTVYIPVQVYPIPVVSLRTDTTVVVGSDIMITPILSPDVTNVVWQNPIGLVSNAYPSIVVHPTGETKYTVKVSNPGGCTATATTTVYVTCGGGNVFIPNTFSPNSDGANDAFYVRGTGLYKVKQISVFNRWGEQVFTKMNTYANDPSVGWDGTFKGTPLTSDVFVYLVEIVCENGQSLLYKGNLTLLR